MNDGGRSYPATADAEAERQAERNRKIPTGILKNVEIAHIHWDHRFRTDMGNIEDLAESIREKGLLTPITLSSDLTLLAGERRLTACKMAGLTKIPALVRKIEGEIDAREIELFENIWRADFTWSERCLLTAEIDRLYKEKNMEWSGRKTAQLLDKSVMSVARDIKMAKALKVMPELGELKTADEAHKRIAQLEESVIVDELRVRQNAMLDADAQNEDAIEHAGSIVSLGTKEAFARRALSSMLRQADNNYRVGDTFKGLTELRSNGVIHIIECDPPYGIDLTKVKGSKDTATSNVHTYNEVEQVDYLAFLDKLCGELYRVAGRDCWLIFWFGPSWQHEVLMALRKAQWQVDEIPSVWIKRHGQTLQPELYFARGYEPFYLARKGQPVMAKRGRLNVFDFPGEAGAKKYHPTQRPVPLIQDILGTLGVPTNIVLVPFLGSGATLRACYNTGMSGFGWDLSDEYKDKFMLAVEDDCRALDLQVPGTEANGTK